MIKYIENNNHLGIIFDKKKNVIKKPALSIVKDICFKHLTSYEGYIKSIRYLFSFHRNIPLLLSKELILFPIKSVRDYENIWINYRAIEKTVWHGKQMTLYFYDGSNLCVTYSRYQYSVLINRIEEIKDYKAKNIL